MPDYHDVLADRKLDRPDGCRRDLNLNIYRLLGSFS